MRALWLLLVATTLVSCLSSNLPLCEDGIVCPAGYTCTTGGCFSPVEVSACADIDEGGECQTPDGRGYCVGGGCATVVCGNGLEELGEVCDDGNTRSDDGCNGTCTSDESCGNGIIELDEQCDPPGDACSATCFVIRCGNNVIDPGEVCDDGNLEPLDGCYADCLSDETCGNGIVDFAKSEQCDDGNEIAFDGCGQCLIEVLDWRPVPQAAPGARAEAATAYDVARGRVVMFGGQSAGSNGILDETWESTGSGWIRRTPRVSPTRRHGAMMTYDSTRHRVVLFGGAAGQTRYNDTWSYDGVTWTRIDPLVKPPPRLWGMLAYDPVRDRIVLYGGFDGAGPLGDTWEFDGVTWTQRVLTPNPGPLHSAAAAFDPVRGVVVVHGGRIDTFSETAAVWDLGATGWTSRGNANTTRWGHCLVFDAAAGKMVSVVGAVSNALSNSVIDFDGAAAWTTRTVTGTPPTGRVRSSCAYDIAHDRIVVFGGATFEPLSLSDGFALTPVDAWVPDAAPAASLESARMYDDLRRGRVRMFGGLVGATGNVTNATLELAGDRWLTVDDPPDADVAYPSPRREHGLAYDSARGVTVIFGGRTAGASGVLGDTWEFDGTTWTKDTAAQPSARFQVAMAYDARRAVTVMFGGVVDFVATDETWEYDGTWTLRSPATKPPGDAYHVMAYDARRGMTVLVTTTGETWEWNGTTWTEIATPVSPPQRNRAALAFHADRGTMVLTAGLPTTLNGGGYSDTWEYDGTTWSPVLTALLPTDRVSHGMTFSALRHGLVIAGGNDGGVLDTWELAHQPGRGVEVCESAFDYDGDGAVGCADAECWPVCTPTCPLGAPAAQCQTTPRCGDGLCSPIENCRTCAPDCTCPAALCGDGYCETPENVTTCPGDC